MAGFAAIVLVLAGFTAWPIRGDGLRDRLAADLARATGLRVTLRGPVSVALLPTPRLIFEDFDLGVAEPGALRLRAGVAHAAFALLPILGGRHEIASIGFEQATIEIAGIGDISAPAAPPSTAPATSPSPRITELRLDKSTIELSIAGGPDTLRLDDVSGRFDWPFAEAAASFAGTARVGAAPVTMSGFAAQPVALRQGGETAMQLRLVSPDFSANLDGAASLRDGMRFKGMLHGGSRLLAALLAPGDPAPFGAGSIDADLDLAHGVAQLTNLRVVSGPEWLEGSLQASAPKPGPARGPIAVGGTLAASRLSGTPLLSWLPAMLVEGQHRWSGEPLALEWLRHIDLDLRLSATRVTVAALSGEDMALSLLLRNGRFDVNLDALSGYGGRMRARLTGGVADAGGALAALEAGGEVHVEGLDMTRLAGDMPGLGRLSGTVGGGASLAGGGASVSDYVSSLAGAAQLTLASGEIRGLNFEQALRRLERKPGSVPAALASGATAFDKLEAAANIEKGVARIENGNLAGPGVTAAFKARIDLPALRVEAASVAALNGATPEGGSPRQHLAVDITAAPGEFAAVPRLSSADSPRAAP